MALTPNDNQETENATRSAGRAAATGIKIAKDVATQNWLGLARTAASSAGSLLKVGLGILGAALLPLAFVIVFILALPAVITFSIGEGFETAADTATVRWESFWQDASADISDVLTFFKTGEFGTYGGTLDARRQAILDATEEGYENYYGIMGSAIVISSEYFHDSYWKTEDKAIEFAESWVKADKGLVTDDVADEDIDVKIESNMSDTDYYNMAFYLVAMESWKRQEDTATNPDAETDYSIMEMIQLAQELASEKGIWQIEISTALNYYTKEVIKQLPSGAPNAAGTWIPKLDEHGFPVYDLETEEVPACTVVITYSVNPSATFLKDMQEKFGIDDGEELDNVNLNVDMLTRIYGFVANINFGTVVIGGSVMNCISDFYENEDTSQINEFLSNGSYSTNGYIDGPFPGWQNHITAPYGDKGNFVHATGHDGVDISVAIGTPLYAASDGVIVSVQSGFPPDNDLYPGNVWKYNYSGNAERGNYIVIYYGEFDGNSLTVLYQHLASVSVSSGQHVSAGELLGTSGSSGKSTGGHYHISTYIGTKGTCNPCEIMR